MILGLISSIFYSLCIMNKEKEPPNICITIYPILYQGMIIIPISEKSAIHIHHWILYSFLLLFYIFIDIEVIGFMIGMIVQGLSYRDRFHIIEKNPF